MYKKSVSQSFHDHFSGVAGRYADYRPQYPAELFDFLSTVADGDAPVWDCACGNGQASVGLARHFGNIIATDASKEQVGAATPHSAIEYRVAPAEQSGLPDQAVGLVTVAQAAHWFDFDRFYGEVKRVLRPGGVIAVWAYGILVVEDDESDRIARDFYANTVGPYWPPERVLVEEGYRTIPFPFSEITPPAFRMETRWTLDQLLGYFSSWSATSRYIKATGQNPLTLLRAELGEAWGDPAVAKRIVWPLSIRVGRV